MIMKIKKNVNNLHNIIIKETGSKERGMVLVFKKLKSIIMKIQIIIFQLISLMAMNMKVILKIINTQAMGFLSLYFHMKKNLNYWKKIKD
jgi:hypothetical protein